MLSAESLEKFKKIHLEIFGENLSDADVLKKAQVFFNLYKIIFKDKNYE